MMLREKYYLNEYDIDYLIENGEEFNSNFLIKLIVTQSIEMVEYALGGQEHKINLGPKKFRWILRKVINQGFDKFKFVLNTAKKRCVYYQQYWNNKTHNWDVNIIPYKILNPELIRYFTSKFVWDDETYEILRYLHKTEPGCLWKYCFSRRDPHKEFLKIQKANIKITPSDVKYILDEFKETKPGHNLHELCSMFFRKKEIVHEVR